MSSLAFMGRRNDKQHSRAEGSTGVGLGGGRLFLGEGVAGRPLEQTGFEGRPIYDGPAAFFTAPGAGVVTQVGISRVVAKPFIPDDFMAGGPGMSCAVCCGS